MIVGPANEILKYANEQWDNKEGIANYIVCSDNIISLRDYEVEKIKSLIGG